MSESSESVDDDAVAGMVRACRPDWTLRAYERSAEGTDFVAYVTCGTPGGEREAVLKATTAGFVDPAVARAEPRLFALVGRETTIPVPEVYGFVDDHPDYPAPFSLVERLPGENFEGRPGDLSPAARERVVRDAGRNLAALHDLGPLPRVGSVGVRDGDLAVLDGEHGPCDGFREWLRASAENALDALADGTFFPERAAEPDRFADLVPALRDCVEERVDALPDPDPPTYCHWDYRYGNLLVDPATGRTEAVLDWANLSATDPAYNLAKAEAHLLDPVRDPAEHTAALRTALREGYSEARDGWTFDASVTERIETYLLVSRLSEMACLPLWYPENDERDEREADHRAFVARYL